MSDTALLGLLNGMMSGNVANPLLALANEHKEEGNKFFKAREFEKALEHYTQAIVVMGNSDGAMMEEKQAFAVYYANRSAAKYQLQDYQGAVEDAGHAIQQNPTYAKGHIKLVAALEVQQKFEEARQAMTAGRYAVEPKDQDMMEKRQTEFIDRYVAHNNETGGSLQSGQKAYRISTRDFVALMDKLEHDLRTVEGWNWTWDDIE
ncbi:MAG: hypothetical protein SGILL_009146, partial [Bacillariaceae sp.]